MLHKLSFALVLLAIGQFARAQVFLPGSCPEVTLMTEFDLEAYTGLWYEYAKYPFFWEIGTKCSSAKYGDLGDNTVSVRNEAVNIVTGAPSVIHGYGKVLGPGILAVVFFPGTQEQSEPKPNYRVLWTDYKNFSVVHSCSKLLGGHTEFLWILTREAHPSEEVIAEAMKVVAANRLSEKYIVKTDQENCPDNRI